MPIDSRLLMFHRRRQVAPPINPVRLLDEFTTNASAPLPSPRTCEPGPGQLWFPTPSSWSITGQRLTQSTNSWRSVNIGASGGVPRASIVGLAHCVTMVAAWRSMLISHISAGDFVGGLDADAGPAVGRNDFISIYRICVKGNWGKTAKSNAARDIWDTATTRRVGWVLQTSGSIIFEVEPAVRRLLWVDNTESAATHYPQYTTRTFNQQCDDLRVTDIGAIEPFSWATSRVISPVAGSNGTRTTATPGGACLEMTPTSLGSSGSTDLWIRWVSATNGWYVRIATNGSGSLVEVVDGVHTTRATTGSNTFAAGRRIWVMDEVDTIRVWDVDSTASHPALSYTGANTHQTATTWRLNAVATGATMSNIVAYPRDISSLIPEGV